METRATRFGLWTWTVLLVLFLYLPIAIIVVYAFNSSNIQSWPISGFTTKWFASTWHNREVREALVLSLKAALVATSIALVLGSVDLVLLPYGTALGCFALYVLLSEKGKAVFDIGDRRFQSAN